MEIHTFWKLYTLRTDLSCWAASMKPPRPSLDDTTAVQCVLADDCFQEARDVPVWMSWRDIVPGLEAEPEAAGAVAQRTDSLRSMVVA